MVHDSTVLRAEFSPDGTRVVTASADETARLWDARTGMPIGTPMRHTGNVWGALFSADGAYVATASADRTARIWDGWTGRALSGPMRHDWSVHDAIMSPDGTHLLTIAMDRRRFRLWPVLKAGDSESGYLADFAEAVSGFHVDAQNAVVPVQDRAQAFHALRSLPAKGTGPSSDLDRFAAELMEVGVAR
jgi:WD40 repeat protein